MNSSERRENGGLDCYCSMKSGRGKMKKQDKKGFFAKYERVFVILAALVCIVTAVSSVYVLQHGLEALQQQADSLNIFVSQLEINFNNVISGNVENVPQIDSMFR
jgi:cell division protein FtsL